MIFGMNPAPMPWIGCGEGWPPDSTGEATGSTANTFSPLHFCLSTLAQPVMWPKLQVFAVEPSASPVISGGKPSPHPIQGIGAGFIPKNLNVEIIDETILVANEDAFATAQYLNQEEGLPAGISTGANVWAAIQVAKRPEFQGKRVVTIGASATERYLSTLLAEKVREEVASLPVAEI